MPATTVQGIFELAPNPDAGRLTICIGKHHKTPRPTEFADADDVQLVTFARARNGFVDFPKNVTVTMLDPDGRPADGASIFASLQLNHPEDPTAAVLPDDVRDRPGRQDHWGVAGPARTGPGLR